MPKQTYLPPILFLMIILMPGTGFSAKPIQTSQQVVVIDAGHGGAQSGLVSPTGLKEKNITLKLAKKTARKLESRYNALMTRNSDIDMSAEERMSFANQKHAALFISIHLNASTNTPAAFFYCYDISDTAYGLKNTGTDTWISRPLANKDQSRQTAKQFAQIFAARYSEIKTHIQQMPIHILEGAAMTALLIEPVSISELPSLPSELEAALDIYAQLIADCVNHYFINQ